MKRSLIRVPSSGKKKKKNDKRKAGVSDSEMEDDEEEPEELEVGMAIEAQYGGKSKWYKGTVMKVHKSKYGGPDRWTYDLKYEDGDREQRVKRSLIRVLSRDKKKKKDKGKSRVTGVVLQYFNKETVTTGGVRIWNHPLVCDVPVHNVFSPYDHTSCFICM